ncbi:MAG: hypothetical protein M3Y37_05955, partial [Chloroflexota bacterium]|nr:hypothetical protein [Chloroflexota bacterium]
TWGYALEFPDTWMVETVSSLDDVDTLHLFDFNTGNYLTFYGYANHDGDPEVCMDAVSETLPTVGYVLGEIEEEESDALEFDRDIDVVSRAYTYEGEYSTGPDELTETISCLTVVPGEAVLRIHIRGLARFHTAALADAQDVIDTLVLADQASDAGSDEDEESDDPSPEANGLVDGIYTSPKFGYSLSVPEDWGLNIVEASEALDVLAIQSFDSGVTLRLEGKAAFDGDPESCIEAYVEELPDRWNVIDDLEEIEISEVELPAGVEVAQTAWQFIGNTGASTSSPEDDITENFACLTLIEGEAVLEILINGLTENYDEALDEAQGVLDSLTLADEPVDTDEDDADSDDPPAGDDLTETWESGQYDIVLAYNPADWEISMEDDDPDDQYEFVQLEHTLGYVGIYGDPDYAPDELEDCLDDYLSGLEQSEENDNIREIRGESGEEDDRIWGAWSYEFTPEDGDPVDIARYIECRAYDDITIVIIQITLEEDFEDMAPERETLLEGLSVGDVRSDDDDADADDEDAESDDAGEVDAERIAGEEARKADIPAMFLPLSDLEEFGYEGYGIVYRSYAGMPEYDYGRLAYELETNAATIEERLIDAGLTGFNILIYGLPDFESDGPADIQSNGEPIADIVSYVYFSAFEAANVDDAEAVYDVLDQTQTSLRLEELDGTTTFGDESQIVLFPDWIEYDDERGRFASVNISILHGNFVFQIRLALPYEGPAPTVEQIEEIAERFMERVESVEEHGEAPGLSNLILQMEGEEVFPMQGSYQVIDGEYQQVAGSTTSIEESMEAVGSPVDFYTFRQRYIPADPEATIYEYRSAIIVFASEEDAIASLETRVTDAQAGDPELEERDAPDLGDEAIAFQSISNDDFNESVIYVRIGNVLVRMNLFGYHTPIDLLDELAEMQIDCIESGEICEPIEVPEELIEASTID